MFMNFGICIAALYNPLQVEDITKARKVIEFNVQHFNILFQVYTIFVHKLIKTNKLNLSLNIKIVKKITNIREYNDQITQQIN